MSGRGRGRARGPGRRAVPVRDGGRGTESVRDAEGGAGAVRGAGMGRRADLRRGQGRGVRMRGGGIPRAAKTVVSDEICALQFFFYGMCFMDILFTVSITVKHFLFYYCILCFYCTSFSKQ